MGLALWCRYALGQYRVIDLTKPPAEGQSYDPRDLRGNLAPDDDRQRYNFTNNGLLLKEGEEAA